MVENTITSSHDGTGPDNNPLQRNMTVAEALEVWVQSYDAPQSLEFQVEFLQAQTTIEESLSVVMVDKRNIRSEMEIFDTAFHRIRNDMDRADLRHDDAYVEYHKMELQLLLEDYNKRWRIRKAE